MVLESLVNDYFIYPLVNQTGEYNLVNTVTYAVVFFIVFYLLYEKVLKDRIKINLKFAIAFTSFVFLAAGIRVLNDMKILTSLLFVTPPIYVFMYAVFLVSLGISLVVEKTTKIEYWKTLSAIAAIPATVIIIFILSQTQNIAGLLFILISLVVSSSAVYVITLRFSNLLSKQNFVVMTAHMLDASATFVSLHFFGYTEQHVLPSFLINIFGPAVMFPLKLLVIGAALYILDKDIKNEQAKTFFKILVFILGLAPGLRDTLSLAVLG